MFSLPFAFFADYSQDEKALLGACDCTQSKWPGPASVQPPPLHSPVNPKIWQQQGGAHRPLCGPLLVRSWSMTLSA